MRNKDRKEVLLKKQELDIMSERKEKILSNPVTDNRDPGCIYHTRCILKNCLGCRRLK
ncbi:Uncharacterised protein [uncultured archaeon]|nr:Uncharacterised protein [uncultured archaeon]